MYSGNISKARKSYCDVNVTSIKQIFPVVKNVKKVILTSNLFCFKYELMEKKLSTFKNYYISDIRKASLRPT